MPRYAWIIGALIGAALFMSAFIFNNRRDPVTIDVQVLRKVESMSSRSGARSYGLIARLDDGRVLDLDVSPGQWIQAEEGKGMRLTVWREQVGTATGAGMLTLVAMAGLILLSVSIGNMILW